LQRGSLRVDAAYVRRVLWEKERLARELESRLPRESVERARRDWHARRSPIPCGMTIHTGMGCSYGCAYCYIYDMGFTMKPQPYPLTGEELVYALTVNPYLVPGPHGTLLAFGSVTEPFMPETAGRALEYLRATRDMLGNPQQVSTKTALKGRLLREFMESADPKIDVLVTITTLRRWKALEPGASPPEERLEFMKALSSAGFSVTLFLRPIIPGVTDAEAEEILARAAEAGARKVVPGTLRVTPGILRRLAATKVVDVGEIEARLPRRPRGPRDQVPIKGRDLKERIIEAARSLGLKVLPASCSSNIESHGLACAACNMGPCGDPERLPEADESALWEILKAAGVKAARARLDRYTATYWYEPGTSREALRRADQLIIALLKRAPRAVKARGRR